MGGNDGIDDGGEVVNVGKSFHAEDDVVERYRASVRGIFGVPDN